jgi:hypothetical protein
MDFMGIFVSGLVVPVLWRQYYLVKGEKVEIQRRNYLENEVYIVAYARPGDEFTAVKTPLEFLYEKWLILSRKQMKTEKRIEENKE